jgi:hypothetical protein
VRGSTACLRCWQPLGLVRYERRLQSREHGISTAACAAVFTHPANLPKTIEAGLEARPLRNARSGSAPMLKPTLAPIPAPVTPGASGSQRGSALRSAFCIRHARCRTWSISSTESYFVVARSGDVADPGVGGVALAAPNLQIPHLHATDRKIWNLELDLNGSSHH